MTPGNEDPIHEMCIPHEYRGEARVRADTNIIAESSKDLEEMNLSTKRKSTRQGLASVEDLTTILSEGRGTRSLL